MDFDKIKVGQRLIIVSSDGTPNAPPIGTLASVIELDPKDHVFNVNLYCENWTAKDGHADWWINSRHLQPAPEVDHGVDMVLEFHKAFACHIAEAPGVPDYTIETGADLVLYAAQSEALGRSLRTMAANAQEAGDEAGALVLIRLQLIQEELAELADAFVRRDIVATLDALGDLSYVVDGTYITCGLQDKKLAALREIHRSNMSKLGEDGKPILSPGGRVVKGPKYEPPDLEPIVK